MSVNTMSIFSLFLPLNLSNFWDEDEAIDAEKGDEYQFSKNQYLELKMGQ